MNQNISHFIFKIFKHWHLECCLHERWIKGNICCRFTDVIILAQSLTQVKRFPPCITDSHHQNSYWITIKITKESIALIFQLEDFKKRTILMVLAFEQRRLHLKTSALPSVYKDDIKNWPLCMDHFVENIKIKKMSKLKKKKNNAIFPLLFRWIVGS